MLSDVFGDQDPLDEIRFALGLQRRITGDVPYRRLQLSLIEPEHIFQTRTELAQLSISPSALQKIRCDIRKRRRNRRLRRTINGGGIISLAAAVAAAMLHPFFKTRFLAGTVEGMHHGFLLFFGDAGGDPRQHHLKHLGARSSNDMTHNTMLFFHSEVLSKEWPDFGLLSPNVCFEFRTNGGASST